MTTPKTCAKGATVAMIACVIIAGSDQSGRADDEKYKPPTISVTGTGKISAKPDIAEIQVGVVTRAETAQAALAQNNRLMEQLYQVLKEQGVAEKDIQTSQMQVSPQYSQPAAPIPVQIGAPVAPPAAEFIPRIVGYNVDNTVRITSRHISKLGPLLDALVQAGANQIHGISFRVEKPEQLLDEVRKRAMADAKHKAELLAGEAGVVVGLPLKIEEQAGFPHPTPMPYGFGAAPMMAAAAPMKVSPGEQELSITVSVVYELVKPK